MAALTNYLEGNVLDRVLRGVTTPDWSTGNHYIALFTAAPTDAGGGTEVTGGAYARVAIARATGSWAAPAGTPRVTSNAAAITFPSPTANWGTVTHFAVMDASTAGNMLMWAALGTSRTINNGDNAPSFAAGALTISLD